MAKSIKDTPKKRRGRPSTGGRREGVMVRLEPAQFEALDGWIKKHAPDLSRPEAIRRLVEIGLTAKAEVSVVGRRAQDHVRAAADRAAARSKATRNR